MGGFFIMTEFIRPKIDFRSFTGKPVNQFAFQQVLKNTGVDYQYLIDDNWTNISPDKRPQSKRAFFPDIESFRKAREAYFTWTDLSPFIGKEKPVFPEEIIKRFMNSISSRLPLTIFIPWGFRTEGQFGWKETETMNKINEILSLVNQRKINQQVLIMLADIYATEINNLPVSAVKEYFFTVEQEAKKRSYQVLPWSKIRNNNLRQYEVLCQKYTNEEINKILPQYVINSALKAAEKRGQTKNCSLAYLRERLCEAEIIEERFKPVKLSMVAKNKDEGVDLNLPRLYLIPEYLRFPWL